MQDLSPSLGSPELLWLGGAALLAAGLLGSQLRSSRSKLTSLLGLSVALLLLSACATGRASAARTLGWGTFALTALAVLRPLPRAPRRALLGVLVTASLVIALLLRAKSSSFHHGHALILALLPLVVARVRPRPKSVVYDGEARPAVRFECPRCAVRADWAEGGYPCPECGLFVHADWTPREGEDRTRLANPVEPRGARPIRLGCPSCGRRDERAWGRSECVGCGAALRLSWNLHLLPDA